MISSTVTLKGSRLTDSKGALLMVQPAEENIPLAWAPLLTVQDLRRVTEIDLSKFSTKNAAGEDEDCTECSQRNVMHVEAAMLFNDTVCKFLQTDGAIVTIDRGKITVDRLDALDPKANKDATYEACGSATCSSIRISGIDHEALRQQAKALGYDNARRSAGKAKQCKKHAATKTTAAAAKADGAADDGAGDGGGGR